MNGKRVGSLCSGAGGFDLGFHRAGYRTAWACEIDPWRRALLQQRLGCAVYPDISGLDPGTLERVDVLIGGTPCQDLSVAGQRAGLDGERSGLFWHFMRVRNHLEPEWTVWENVAGALSSNDGLDFASVLAAFVGADVLVPGGGWPGAGVAAGPWGGCVYRVLDAQHFGVPQRRRRVFVVGRLGGPCPPEVLLERAGGGGDPATRRGARQGTASPLEDGTGVTRTLSTSNERLDGDTESFVVGALMAKRVESGGWRIGADEAAAGHIVARTLRAEGFDASEDGTGRGTPLVCAEPAPRGTRERHGRQLEGGRREAGAGLPGGEDRLDGAAPDPDGVRAPDGLAGRVDVAGVTAFYQDEASGVRESGDAAIALWTNTGGAGNGVQYVMGDVPAGDRCAHDPQPDGRRYAACGDGVVANVAEWIARRIVEHGGEAT